MKKIKLLLFLLICSIGPSLLALIGADVRNPRKATRTPPATGTGVAVPAILPKHAGPAERAAATEVLTFDRAVSLAVQRRAVDPPRIVLPPDRNVPTVRAEAGINSARDVNILTSGVTTFDSLTALVAVDYSLYDAGARASRRNVMATDLALLEFGALDDREQAYRETLDAFARLYTASRQIEVLGDAVRRAARLRERAQRLLRVREISTVTAAQWRDQAYIVESQLLDLQLQRLTAETRLKELMGDTSTTPLRVELKISEGEGSPHDFRLAHLAQADSSVVRARIEEEKRKTIAREAASLRKPQVSASAFAGFASIPGRVAEAEDQNFGIYGLRVNLALPMFDAASAMRLAQTSIELEHASRARRSAENAARDRLEILWLSLAGTEKRVSLLTDSVEIARERQQSIMRLVNAGIGTEVDLFNAVFDLARREAELVAARVERWRLRRLMLDLASHGEKLLAAAGDIEASGKSQRKGRK